jgi:5-methylcytosine-specific restriction endonuclease McrBC regulatory subunit McrC
MYQLYAYGQKYKIGESSNHNEDITPKLILLYPYSEKFTKKLPVFTYDELPECKGLKLMAVPFNLADSKTYKEQIEHIIKLEFK